QAVAQGRPFLLLVRVPPMHDNIDAVEPAREKPLVGLELERVRHDADGIRQHAVLRHDGVALDAAWRGHVLSPAWRGGASGSGSPWKPIWRVVGSASGCSFWRKAIICSRTWQRRSKAAPALLALMMARTSMVVCLTSVTWSLAVWRSQASDADTMSWSFSRIASIGAR